VSDWTLGELVDVAPDYETQEWRQAILADGTEVGAAYALTPDEAIRLARLMAAAPLLLAACRDVLAVAEHDPILWRRLQGGLEVQIRAAFDAAVGSSPVGDSQE
jgi:hypothetical protein